VLSGEGTNINFRVFGLTRPEQEPRFIALEESELTITPPMQLSLLRSQF
jgi:hypothetical protein